MSSPIPTAVPPVDLILHIGSGKTGTTSIQTFMHVNRGRLAERGILYPRTPGLTRHARISLSVLSDQAVERTPVWHRQGFQGSVGDVQQQVHDELCAEIAEAGLPRVVLSDEALYGTRWAAVSRLRELTDRLARSVRIVVYLRRQDDHVASRYQQVVKVGETRRLVERVAALDLSGFYDYHRRLSQWQSTMEPTAFVVRRFERASFSSGSLHEDFLEAAGIDVPVDAFQDAVARNESLDAEAVELLRLLNLFRVEQQGASPGQIDNRGLIRRLKESAGDVQGPTLTLPPAALDRFMGQWEESNRAVARDFLGDSSGELFRAPRKTSNTTSDQILDPARLDHFLEVLELPEEQHAPLRALAEREASTA